MLSYIDDLIIPSVTCEERIAHLKVVLETASRYRLVINWRKCHFLQTRVKYLGDVIESGTICPLPRKTEAVFRFPEPSNVRQV